MENRRRHERIRASFVLRILSVEKRMRVRTGDVSAHGLFVELDQEVGTPGELLPLRLGTRDGLHAVDVEARVIRVVRADDLLTGRHVTGVAFELVVADPILRARVDELVSHLARGELGAIDELPREAVPPGVRVRLETPWRLRAGERVRVDVPSPEGRRLSVEARALDSRARKDGSYATRFELEPNTEHERGEREVTGIRLALAHRRPQLAGELGTLSLPTVLMLASMEQLSGVLRLHHPEHPEVRVYLRRGTVVDAEGLALGPRETVATATTWTTGVFELAVREVTREDRLQTSTTALLLDLAREADERRREVA